MKRNSFFLVLVIIAGLWSKFSIKVVSASGLVKDTLPIRSSFKTFLPILISEGSSNQPLSFMCDANEVSYSNNYAIMNSQWNRNVVIAANEPYSQCLYLYSIKPLTIGWNWSWPNIQGQVKSYPCIIYGWMAWLPYSTDQHLPVQLSQMGSFVSEFDTSVTGQEVTYNTSFDLWITSSNPPSPETITNEVMIWVEDKTDWSLTDLHFIERVTIDQQQYDLFSDPRRTDWNYFLYKKVVPMPIGSLSVDHFLNFLVNQGYISGNEFLTDIEFGNELISGSGQTAIRYYSITASD